MKHSSAPYRWQPGVEGPCYLVGGSDRGQGTDLQPQGRGSGHQGRDRGQTVDAACVGQVITPRPRGPQTLTIL